MIVIVLAAAALAALAVVWQRLDEFFSEYPHLWRLLSGNYLTKRHGREPVARKRRLRRAGIRTGTLTGVVGFAWAYTYHRTGTITAAAVAAVAAVAFLTVYVWRHPLHPIHHVRWVRPARRAVIAELGHPPTTFKVTPGRDEVRVGLPGEQVYDDKQQKALEYAVTERLAISAAPTWRQWGGRPLLVLRRVEPPPSLVTLADLEDACAMTGPNELVVGIGADGKIITVSLTQDSPHFAVSAGSGAGKSNLIAFWLLQELRRGAIALILDAKWTSHPWVFKDMDAEYGQLPCVRYARRTEDLHEAMCWLDTEIDRRSQVADLIINAKGDLLTSKGSVGSRLWVLAEEMNLASDRLKQHWAEIREKGQPSRSPAFKGFGACSQAGRALGIHEIASAQQMTAAAVGGGAVRENFGVRLLSRYQPQTWKMLAGDLAMPPSVTTPGRMQCIIGSSVEEVQTPLMDPEQVRELVLASAMTGVPADMPGIATSVFRPTVPAGTVPALVAPDVGLSIGQAPEVGRPPGTMTVREAYEADWFPTVDAARKHAQRHLDPVGEERGAKLYRITDLKGER